MKSFLKLLFGIPFVAVLLLAAPAEAQVKHYAIVTGDPCCGIPDEMYKYMDANSGCQAEIQVPADTACENNHPDTLRSFLGPHPTQPSTCVYNWDCLCGSCLIGEPSNPANFNKISVSQTNAYGKVKDPCTGGTWRDFLACTFHKAKSKGTCPDDNCEANPVNVMSRNKFQSESVYRSGSGELDLVLWYNSQAGVHYFVVGAFGANWTSRYFVKVNDSFQGIIAVNRPDGKECAANPGSGLNTASARIVYSRG